MPGKRAGRVKAKTRFWRVFASPSFGEFTGGGRTTAASNYVLADEIAIVKGVRSLLLTSSGIPPVGEWQKVKSKDLTPGYLLFFQTP